MKKSIHSINEQIQKLHNFVPYTKTNQFDFVFIYRKLLVIFVQFSDLLIYSIHYSEEISNSLKTREM